MDDSVKQDPEGGDPGGSTSSPGRRAAIGAGAVAAAVVVFGGTVALVEGAGSLFAGRSSTIKVNGQDHTVQADPDTPLLYVLRNEAGLQGPRFGCGLTECGACTVQVDRTPVRSCATKVSTVMGRSITTVEGLGSSAKPHPLQKAFIDQQAVQCGYCISGMIMEAEALLRSHSRPTDAAIKSALAGHLCRCGTQYRIVRAVKAAAGTL
jgi:nicotinate dehydrogenase subunit A